MVFGGRKALGLVPSLDSITAHSVHFLQSRLERRARSKATHYWRGTLAALLLAFSFGAVGYGLDQLVFFHPALTAIAVFFVAKFLSLKISWQLFQNTPPAANNDQCRQLARQPIALFSNYYAPAVVLFIAGGFTLLLPFSCLHAASLAAEKTQEESLFFRPFQRMRSVAAFPGEVIGTALLAIALLFWPTANWSKGWLSVFRLGKSVKLWPLIMTAHAFNWSFERLDGERWTDSSKQKWLGPADGSAQLRPTDVKNALIVALIAFGIANALLGLLWLAAAIG